MAQIVHDAKAIKAKLASIAKRSTSIRNDVDYAARCIILHAVVHGDVTFAGDLTVAMGDGWRLNALRAWFGNFGPMGWANKTKDKAAHFTLNKDKRNEMLEAYTNDAKAFVQKLENYPTYWAFKPEAEFEGFDLIKEAKKLLARAKAKADPEKYPDQSKINLAGLAQLEAMVAANQLAA